MMQDRRLLYDGRAIGVALRPHLRPDAGMTFSPLIRGSCGAFEKVAAALIRRTLEDANYRTD